MTKSMNMKVSIHPIPGKTCGLEACLGDFDCQMSLEQSRLIADFIWFFKGEQFNALVATYLFGESRWKKANRLGWKPHLKKTFTRQAWFPRTIDYDWVIGSCPSVECLQEVIHTGWNVSGNESFITILTQDIHEVLPKIARTYQDNLGDFEANELEWMDDCPFVFSRDHDGLTLRLFTLSLRHPERPGIVPRSVRHDVAGTGERPTGLVHADGERTSR